MINDSLNYRTKTNRERAYFETMTRILSLGWFVRAAEPPGLRDHILRIEHPIYHLIHNYKKESNTTLMDTLRRTTIDTREGLVPKQGHTKESVYEVCKKNIDRVYNAYSINLDRILTPQLMEKLYHLMIEVRNDFVTTQANQLVQEHGQTIIVYGCGHSKGLGRVSQKSYVILDVGIPEDELDTSLEKFSKNLYVLPIPDSKLHFKD